MRAPVYSCVRLGAHAVEPHRNHHASCSDVPGNGITESRTYSIVNLLTAINYSNASLGNLTYSWDTNKNKKSESIGGVMSGYGFTNAGTTYDDEDRLTGYQRTNGALSQSWNLTAVGDWNSVTTSGIGFQPVVQNRTHGPTHELLTAGGQTVNTDVKGNITLLPAVLASSLLPPASRLKPLACSGISTTSSRVWMLGTIVRRMSSTNTMPWGDVLQESVAVFHTFTSRAISKRSQTTESEMLRVHHSIDTFTQAISTIQWFAREPERVERSTIIIATNSTRSLL